MDDRRLNTDFKEVARGYQSMAREFEGQLERATAVIRAQQKEVERLTSRVTTQGDTIASYQREVEGLKDEGQRFVDNVVRTIGQFREDLSRERQMVVALRRSRGTIINVYEDELLTQAVRSGQLFTALRNLAEVYQELYDGRYGTLAADGTLPDESAYKQALQVLEGGPDAQSNESGRSDSAVEDSAAGRGDGIRRLGHAA